MIGVLFHYVIIQDVLKRSSHAFSLKNMLNLMIYKVKNSQFLEITANSIISYNNFLWFYYCVKYYLNSCMTNCSIFIQLNSNNIIYIIHYIYGVIK